MRKQTIKLEGNKSFCESNGFRKRFTTIVIQDVMYAFIECEFTGDKLNRM